MALILMHSFVRFLPCAVAVLAAALFAIVSASARAAEPIRISGGGSALGLMRLLGDAYQKQTPGANIVVLNAMGSSGGIKGVSQGILDIAVSNRGLSADEVAQQLVSREYARTLFVIVAGKDFPLDKLSSQELARLYATAGAEIVPGRRVRPILRPANDSDTKLMKSFTPELAAALDASLARPGMVVAKTDTEAADLVESTPGAIGASTLGMVRTENRRLKILAIDGRKGDAKETPYFKAVYVVTKRTSAEGTRRFVEFMDSAAAREIATTHGFTFLAAAKR